MPRRRRVLTIVAGGVGLSGCSDRFGTGSSSPTGTETATETATGTPSPDPTPEPTPTPEPFDGRWPMFGGDARNTGVAAPPGPRDPDVDWRFGTEERIDTDPVVGSGTVVVGTVDDTLVGVSAAAGSERWRFDLPSPPHGTPAIHDGRVFVETEDHGVFALDATDGAFAWWRSTEATFRTGAAAIHDGTAYVAVDGAVVGIDAATGERRTRLTFDRPLARPLAIADGVCYVAWERDDEPGKDRGGGLDAVTLDGERRWRVKPGFPKGGPAVANGTVVWTTEDAAHAYDIGTGEERWRFAPAGGAGSPAIADGVVYIGSTETSFHALELTSGEPVWSVETTSRPNVAPVVAGDMVYYGSGAHRVYARDVTTGEKLWYRQIGWLPSDPALAGGTVFVTGKTELVALRDS